jgi:hypothetical protein
LVGCRRHGIHQRHNVLNAHQLVGQAGGHG